MDDDSFRARVQKVFGSLSSSSSSTSTTINPLWSLTDEEVEKREWNRTKLPSTHNHKRDDDLTPSSSSLHHLFNSKRKRIHRKHFGDDYDDDDDFPTPPNRGKLDEHEQDEWEIKSSIGLDSTLDNEDEEDEYDKLAEGRENSGSRLSMGDINGQDSALFTQYARATSVLDVRRDPRANHMAARVRLKEDADVAAKYEASSEESVATKHKPCTEVSEDNSNVKPILKRQAGDRSSKFSKRVRFDPSCKDDYVESSDKIDDSSIKAIGLSEDDPFLGDNKPKVPDYLMYPSKYTRYSLNSSSELDEESNRGTQYAITTSNDSPKLITFIPRNKASDVVGSTFTTMAEQNDDDFNKESTNQAVVSVGIAVAGDEAQQSEGSLEESHMDIDVSATTGSFQKPGRNYRSKSRLDDLVQ